ncbi:MAG: hypothetical protein ACYDBT_02810 [Desulfobulbaceae bacterium]
MEHFVLIFLSFVDFHFLFPIYINYELQLIIILDLFVRWGRKNQGAENESRIARARWQFGSFCFSSPGLPVFTHTT